MGLVRSAAEVQCLQLHLMVQPSGESEWSQSSDDQKSLLILCAYCTFVCGISLVIVD